MSGVRIVSEFGGVGHSRAALLAVLVLAGGSSSAAAQLSFDDVLAPSARQWFELSAGVSGTASAWSAHSSATAALAGDLGTNGYRLRIGGGYGHYRYTRKVSDPAIHGSRWPELFGDQTWADALIGYQWIIGSTAVKVYTGFTEEDHRISPGRDFPLAVDDENLIQGRKRGAKLVLETWSRLADWGFLQVDASWSEPFDTYGGRLRLGYFWTGAWSAGIEASAYQNISHDGGRAGAFVRYERNGSELSWSIGLDGDRDRIGSGYSSVAFTVRF